MLTPYLNVPELQAVECLALLTQKTCLLHEVLHLPCQPTFC